MEIAEKMKFCFAVIFHRGMITGVNKRIFRTYRQMNGQIDEKISEIIEKLF